MNVYSISLPPFLPLLPLLLGRESAFGIQLCSPPESKGRVPVKP